MRFPTMSRPHRSTCYATSQHVLAGEHFAQQQADFELNAENAVVLWRRY